MAKISEIKLPDNSIYQLKDNGALQLTGGTVTGPVDFEDSVYINDLNAGNLIVTGNAAFTNNIQANTINGVEVGPNPKFTDTTYTFDGTYNASTNKAATVNTITNAINNLDGNLNNTTPGAGKTLTAFSQTNGKVSATFGNISITKSQISDFPSTMTPAAHTHDDRYYTETEINNKFTALTNTTTQINHIKFYSGSCNAGKTYIGWIKIASFPMNNSNQLGQNSYEFGIYRGYTSPSSESYNIKINIGWDNASIIQLNGRAGTQIIEKFRLVKDNTNHICYFEMYVNTNNATYQNNVDLRIQKWNNDSVELTLLNTVQTEAESDFQVVSTLDLKPKGIVSNNNFYGNLIGNADTATEFSSNATVTLTGDTTGTSAESKKSWSVNTTTNQLSFKNGRIASANLDISTIHSKMVLTLASSSMITQKPPMGDGYIVTYGWDNSFWGAQQAISHTKTPHMAIRGTNGVSTNDWGDWIYLLDANNYTDYTVTKTGTGATGNWGINITGNAGTATTAGALTNKVLNSTTIHNTAGSFTFQGNGEPWAGTDWVGLQVGSNEDKFQIHAINGTTLGYRQNDSGGTNTSWGAWYSLLSSGNYTDYTVTKTGGGANGTWGIDITGNANTSKYLMNRGSNAVSINDSTWGISIISQGHTIRDKVWHQQWKQSGLKFTPQGGSESNITDSADLVYYLSSSNTANLLALNMAIDGIIYAGLGFKGVWDGNTISIAKGGTGLTASPSMLTNLASTTAASVFQASPRPGVTGTLGIANGGTGQTTVKNAINALLNGLDIWTANPTDDTYFIRQDTSGANSYGKVKFNTVWNYIKTKTNASFNPGSLTITMDTTDKKKALINFTAPSFS